MALTRIQSRPQECIQSSFNLSLIPQITSLTTSSWSSPPFLVMSPSWSEAGCDGGMQHYDYGQAWTCGATRMLEGNDRCDALRWGWQSLLPTDVPTVSMCRYKQLNRRRKPPKTTDMSYYYSR